MSKRTKWTMIIGAAAAVVSAAVLLILFWDRLLEKFPCCRLSCEADFDEFSEDAEDEIIPYEEAELEDFADLSQNSEE